MSSLFEEVAALGRDESLGTHGTGDTLRHSVKAECANDRWARDALRREEAQLEAKWIDVTPHYLFVFIGERETRRLRRIRTHSDTTHRENTRSLEETFAGLVRSWKRDTAHMSIVARMVEHPAYQQIIAMGFDAVPLLLRELAREPDHWFPALRRITGENPVPPDARGDVRKMVNAWLTWGRNTGLIS